MLRIIYRTGDHSTMVANVISHITFKQGYADFDTEFGHQHILTENLIKIGNVKFGSNYRSAAEIVKDNRNVKKC